MADDEDSGGYYEEKPVMFFGRDVSKVPCFRNSFLYGLTSGLFGGLGYFMFTSRIHKSFQVGSASYFVVTLGYWLQCRYLYMKNKIEIDRIQSELMRRIEQEGTVLDEDSLSFEDDS